MMPDDFPDITLTNRYYQPRPGAKEAFGATPDTTLEPEGPKREELPTMQLRCELEIINTGEPVRGVKALCVCAQQLSAASGHFLGTRMPCAQKRKAARP